MYEPWFVWAMTGFVCIGLEMIIPGFVIFFFGVGGLLTALCSLIPFVSDLLWLQVLLFIAFSLISLIFLRKHFSKIFAGSVFDSRATNADEAGIGKIAEVIEPVGAVGEGRIRFQGTSWKALTREGEVGAGMKVKIVAREGMTYIVEPVREESPGNEKNVRENGGK